MTVTSIVDYDGNGYDYRDYWADRGYEERAEVAALHRLVPRLGRPEWFADFGGGYGRNAAHYATRVGHAVIVDYSTTNLRRAAEERAADVAAGRIHLVRADLSALPFTDSAFGAAMVVRVLHHLPALDVALPEMARTVSGRWLVDVPVKHHVLARLRALYRGGGAALRGPGPRHSGDSEYPFTLYQLDAVRELLSEEGWSSHPVASVNNFRRWDRRLPAPLVHGLAPAVLAAERLFQHAGTGWWGPSQFLLATRRSAVESEPRPVPSGVPVELARLACRMVCPPCRAALSWTERDALCVRCGRRYLRQGAYWDFTV